MPTCSAPSGGSSRQIASAPRRRGEKPSTRRAMMRWWGWERSGRPSASASSSSSTAGSGVSVALVVGCTGMVGCALLDVLQLDEVPGEPWKVYALSRRPLPPWYMTTPPAVTHFQVDLAEADDVAKTISPLTDITHVFYLAWDSRTTPAEARREHNCAMLRNVISVVVPNCPALVHVCLQSNEQALEKALLDVLADHERAITWSVHRTTTIFGFYPRSARNIVCNLCVYAAICHKEGVRLRWPGSHGSWEGLNDASDAALVAEHALWAALEPSGKNKLLNCNNGDIFKWKDLWPVLAAYFDVKEYTGYAKDQGFKLEEAMDGKEEVWSEVVRENGLLDTDLGEITNWRFVDEVLNADQEVVAEETANKNKEFGFCGSRNSARSFKYWIKKMKLNNIVP